MPLVRLEKPGYFFIGYRRCGFRDFLELKKILQSGFTTIQKDLIIDFLTPGPLTEWEMSTLVDISSRFIGINNFLKIVADETIRNQIESTLSKAGNVSMHSNLFSLMEKNRHELCEDGN